MTMELSNRQQQVKNVKNFEQKIAYSTTSHVLCCQRLKAIITLVLLEAVEAKLVLLPLYIKQDLCPTVCKLLLNLAYLQTQPYITNWSSCGYQIFGSIKPEDLNLK